MCMIIITFSFYLSAYTLADANNKINFRIVSAIEKAAAFYVCFLFISLIGSNAIFQYV